MTDLSSIVGPGVLKRGDMELIARIVASNGGGVRGDMIPKAQLKRLLTLGLVRWKPVNLKKPWNRSVYGMVIHTSYALDAIARAALP